MAKTDSELVQIDRIDRQILEHLQNDGGLTNQQLAERVGLSPRPVHAGSRHWRRPASSLAARPFWIVASWGFR